MKKYFIFYLLLFTLLPISASAEVINVNYALISDTTWAPPDIYIIGSLFSVPIGVTLTIEPGTVVKARTTHPGGPSIEGRLIAHGTDESPIYFTSFFNDDIGGDTNKNGIEALGQGDWQGLYFKPGSEGSFDYVDLSWSGYGGYGYGNYVGIENDGGTVTITNSNIHDNFRYYNVWGFSPHKAGTGISNKNGGTLSVTNSTVENSLWGISDESGNGNTEVINSIIKNNFDETGHNSGYGVYAYGAGSLTLLNNTFEGNDRTAWINAATDFTHVGNTSSDLKERGFRINGYPKDGAVLHGRDLPLIINGGVIARDGNSFTIESGTILKGLKSSYLMAEDGTINITGTNEEPVVFTSIHDDSVGGDTNGNGDVTIPGVSDLTSGIMVGENGQVNISNLQIKYTGETQYVGSSGPQRAAIFNSGGGLEMDGGEISHTDTGIVSQNGATIIRNVTFNSLGIPAHLDGGEMSINNSRFVGSPNFQVQNYGTTVMNAENNWWGAPEGPYHEILNPTGTNGNVQQNIDFIPWLTEDPALVLPAPTINPVIIIPGIMGSAYKNGVWTIDPRFHVYDNLIETLENNGYVREENLFPWGYDWKNSNTESARLLEQKIERAKNTCTIANLPDIDCSKVDIVAHSMGGLVARAYAQSNYYDNDIDQLIFLGTPHRGAPKDYLVWEAGEFPDGTIDNYIKSYFTKEAKRLGYTDLFDYIHGWPITSVKELLPVYDYLKGANSGQLLSYPISYPENNFLEDLNQGLVGFLESDIEITNMVGNTGANTISVIRITDEDKLPLWEHGYPEGYDNLFGDKGLEVGIGDGTVPEYSSRFDNPYDLEIINSSHINLPTDAEEEIYEIINGGELVDPVKTPLPLKILFAKIFSPADFVIIAPDGKRIGKDFAIGQEINEIPMAFYSGFNTEDEYVTIPDPLDGEYKVQLQGTEDGGFYEFETTYISDDVSITTEVSGITEPDQITDLNVQVDNTNPKELETERVITLDIIISDINGAYKLGWIKDQKTRDSLIKQAKLIIKFEKKRNGKYEKKVDKIIIKLLQKELDFLLKKGKINQEAYDLLKTDLEYLINNN